MHNRVKLTNTVNGANMPSTTTTAPSAKDVPVGTEDVMSQILRLQ